MYSYNTISYIILYFHIILYHTILYYIILYYIILYYIILYHAAKEPHRNLRGHPIFGYACNANGDGATGPDEMFRIVRAH